MTPLASRLTGKRVGKWQVLEKRDKIDDNSGAFSSCYRVQGDGGAVGFMKVFNYAYAFANTSSADTLHQLTGDFTYERDLVMFCRDNNLSRVVAAIDSGEYTESGEPYPAPYLVFEIADQSLKNYRQVRNPDLAWKLRMFHGSLVALRQLHSRRIAHQDIKPSNILVFNREVAKIADLGRATQIGNESRHDCGDLRYAPVELLYGYACPEWGPRRYGADLFMMAGVLGFLVADSNLLAMMISKLPEQMRPQRYGGAFDRVLPHLLPAHNDAVEEIAACVPEGPRANVATMLREMSEPDPHLRGNPQRLWTTHPQFSLQRYITIADLASAKALRVADARR